MNKTCENCQFGYKYPDGAIICKICNNPKLDVSWLVSRNFTCDSYEPAKTLEECIEESTPKWMDVDPKEYIDDVRGVPRWHDAESNDLPPIDEEVIVLDKRGKISFAHRPAPNGIHGVSKITGTKYHIEAKTYGKGKWNIPDIRWWMPCPEIPKL